MFHFLTPLIAVLFLSFGTLSIPAKAADEMNISAEGVAIQGYDPVAYFNSGKPVKGSSANTAEYDGAVYHFSTLKNRDAFIVSPSKFAPAFGGWCSYGVRVGKKFNVDPKAWKIVDGRLFLQLDLGTQKVWRLDQRKNIEIADRLWPKIKTVSVAILGK